MKKFIKVVAAIMLIGITVYATGCKKEKKAEVETSPVTNVTSSSATAGGIVTFDGNSSVIERGVCWGRNTNPDVSSSHLNSGTGMGSFSCDITGLDPATTYYVRAYAINNTGISYGSQVTFTTLTSGGGNGGGGNGGGSGGDGNLPTVVTNTVSNITASTATCAGNVTNAGATAVTAKGVCWSTSQNPTIDGSSASAGAGTGFFTCTMTGLCANTNYYVRAYATNEAGTAYGNQIEFTTGDEGGVPVGAISGLFSINNGEKVYFSQGNLQYIGSALSPYWRFAEHQWDYLGETTEQNSSAENVDRDLFGWGTSGFSYGSGAYNQPYHTVYYYEVCEHYGPNSSYLWEESDWGYNPIANGGDEINQWRTLTKYEWEYILYDRSVSSGIRFAKAKVNNVNGVIIVPDNWSNSIYTVRNFNNSGTPYTSNVIDESTWTTVLEANGVVFLPAAGIRSATDVYEVGETGRYWTSTSTYYNYGESDDIEFTNNSFGVNTYICRACGQSVRLVKDAQ